MYKSLYLLCFRYLLVGVGDGVSAKGPPGSPQASWQEGLGVRE